MGGDYSEGFKGYSLYQEAQVVLVLFFNSFCLIKTNLLGGSTSPEVLVQTSKDN